ncbi:MAG: hypothetical protein QOF90_3250, partial [Acetobacteraceae bacterium]|nr:hypothetical protein [Acetobacteraceae bacterium]
VVINEPSRVVEAKVEQNTKTNHREPSGSYERRGEELAHCAISEPLRLYVLGEPMVLRPDEVREVFENPRFCRRHDPVKC